MEIQVGAILLQMLNFGIVASALTFLLLKPVRKILDERSRKVEEGQNAAAAAIASQEEAQKSAEKIIAAAQQKAKDIVEEARHDAEKTASQVIQTAENKAQEILKKASSEAAAQKKAALQDLQKNIEKTIVAISKRVIKKEINPEEHQQLITDGLQQIKEA